MPYTVKFDPNSISLQADIIPDANCHQDGIMPKELACKLINLPTGGGGATGATGPAGATGATGPAGSGGDQETVFIFRPGAVGPLASNVFNNWALLMAAVDAKEGLRTIQFDDSIVTPCVVPAGTWDMVDVTWSCSTLFLHPLLPSIVQVVEGAVLPGLRTLDRIRVDFTGSTPPVTDFVVSDLAIFSVQNFSSLQCSGAGPFIRNSVLGSYCTLAVSHYSQVLFGANPVMDIAVPGAIGVLAVFNGGGVAANTVSGVVGAILEKTVIASAALIEESQPAFLGSTQHQNLSLLRVNPSTTIYGAGLQLVKVNDLARCDLSLGNITIQLPPAFNARGMWIVVKNLDPNPEIFNITVTPTGGDTVDGGASVIFNTPKGSRTFVSDGVSDWNLVASV